LFRNKILAKFLPALNPLKNIIFTTKELYMCIKGYIMYLFFATLFFPFTLLAQGSGTSAGFFSDVNNDISESQEKIISLAEAIPAEKYTWRPEEGVRSVSEVLMHIAGSNYFLISFAGIEIPKDADENMGKDVTDKEKIIQALKTSFKDLYDNLKKLNEADLDKQVKMFGHDSTIRNVIFTEMGHLHEHLGQLIAYARTNGIVPPWSK
jgi:uncharacterized damage-inducible protein DinB